MTYPPTNPGYPAPQQPGGYGGPMGPAYPAPVAAPAKTPVYFTWGVVVLGLAAYLASFGPLLSINADIGPFGGAQFTASGLSYWTVAALFSALLAAVSLLPKSKPYTAMVAVTAVLAVLLVIGQVINRPNGFSVGWALWLVLGFTLLQSAAAVSALLFESGVLTSAAPRPQYAPYGPPPGGYYGQPVGQTGQPGVTGQAPPQRPGYPTPYPGGYPGGGYPQPDTSAPDTPPTGIPSYPPQSGAGSPQPSAEPSSGPAPSSGSAPS